MKAEEKMPRKPQYEPAPPNYEGEPPYQDDESRGRMPIKTESPWKGIIVQAIVALVVVFLMNSAIMPMAGKKAYIADITRLETDLVAIRAVDSAQNTKIDKVVSDAQATITKASDTVDKKISEANTSIDQKVAKVTSTLENYATKSSVSDMDSRITGLNNSLTAAVNDLNSKLSNINSSDINNMKADIAALKVEIANLKVEIANIDTTSGSKKPTVDITERVAPTWTGDTTPAYTWQVGLTLDIDNNTSADIEIPEDGIRIYIDPVTSGTITGVQLITLNKSLAWVPIQTTIPYFYNARTIYVDKGDTETLRLTLTITLSTGVGISGYESEAEITDWN